MANRGEVTPERRLKAQAAAHTRWSRTPDRCGATEAARRGLEARFERQVDPDNLLAPKVRATLAESARKAFYADLASRSVAARRKRK